MSLPRVLISQEQFTAERLWRLRRKEKLCKKKELDIEQITNRHEIFLNNGFSKWYKAEFSDLNLKGYDFSGARLSYAVFNNCNLKGADFSGAELKGTKFISSELENSAFSGADLEKAYFMGSDVKNGIFRKCGLREVKFIGSELSGTDFTGSELVSPEIVDCREKNSNLRTSILLRSKYLETA